MVIVGNSIASKALLYLASLNSTRLCETDGSIEGEYYCLLRGEGEFPRLMWLIVIFGPDAWGLRSKPETPLAKCLF